MFLGLTISNYRSFHEAQTLSMVAGVRPLDHPDHLTSIRGGVCILPVVALYGTTGAGKSNFVKALGYLKRLVLEGTEPKKPTGRVPFALSRTAAEQPSELVLEFVLGEDTFVFGCRIDNVRIEAEWLHRVERGKPVVIYRRTTTTDGHVTVEPGATLIKAGKGDTKKVLSLARIGVQENQLFLHAVWYTLSRQDQGSVLSGVLDWFERLKIIDTASDLLPLAQWLGKSPGVQEFTGGFLKRVGTGVDGVRLASVQMDQEVLGAINTAVRAKLESIQEGELAQVSNSDGSTLLLEKGQGVDVKLRTIQTEHVSGDGDRVVFPFSEESDGTQRLTQLLQALQNRGDAPGVFVIDELDRSLHPLLAKEFVRSFLRVGAGSGGQLIFTTHDTVFLDLDLLRRDEIWFADKRKTLGATTLSCLAEHRIRTDLRIDKAYLQGRFDAVPLIEGDLTEWVEKNVAEQRTHLE